jgi:hypothetical protein
MVKIPATVFATAVLALLGIGSGSAAQPTPVPDRKPDLSAMSYFIGNWTCHQKLRGADRPNTSAYAPAFDGRWIMEHDVAPPFDKYRTKTILNDTVTTYNPLTKQWVALSYDNFGGYGVATSPGWTGSTIVWTATLSNDGSTAKTTITKVSDTEMRYLNVSREKSGKANPDDKGVCKKSA